MSLSKRVAMFALLAAVFALIGNQARDTEASHAATGVIISNGTVQLGVWDTGNLNVPDGPASCSDETDVVGLRYVPTGCDSTAPGCTCEGWGAADDITDTSGYANDADGGDFNMTVESFTHDADSAVSTVMLTNGLRVTHDYHPSPDTTNLYEVAVTIENTSEADVHLLYRRVMDWDVEPTPFEEFVTLNPGTASDLVFTSNDGFASADPLDGPSDIGFTGSFVDAGPDDHGALFDFDFGTLAPGATKSFITFYGAAANEDEAEAALAAVGAEAFSFGQTSCPTEACPSDNGKDQGTPNTFIFAFGKVGGGAIFEPEPDEEPEATATPCIPPLVTYRCDGRPGSGGGGGGGGSAPTSTPAATQPTPVVSVAPATVVPARPAAVAPVGIAAPDTGDGTATAGASGMPIAYALVLAVASIVAGIAVIRIGSRRNARQ